MNSFTTTYDMKHRHKVYHYYQWSSCKCLFNTKTGRKVIKTLNGRSVGYWINRKFIPLSRLKNDIERIPENDFPW